MVTDDQETKRIDAFIERWKGREGGQERANYALFLSEMCGALGLTPPDPASATTEDNDYVFERAVKEQNPDGSTASRRIDLYKRGCFVLEAKQSRLKGGTKEIVVQNDLFGSKPLPSDDRITRGRRSAKASWDVYMLNARRQAEGYARALPVDHGWPPFILVCDVGHVIEVYADFSGQGKNYAQFPDRQSFRIYLEDLRQPEIRTRLSHIWKDPSSLDPARHTARVTRAIAERLADVSKALEKQKHPPEEVALFLMRCLFTMFAEDVGLLPAKAFRQILERCEKDTSKFQPIVSQLWEAMDKGEFAHVLETRVKKFNGEFFKSRDVIPLQREEIGELRRAASYDWRDVDPSIFGTLLEQALDEKERRRLGAHYTPRVYVERLVIATVIEPLRQDWGQSLATAERQKPKGAPRMPSRPFRLSTTSSAKPVFSILPAEVGIFCTYHWNSSSGLRARCSRLCRIWAARRPCVHLQAIRSIHISFSDWRSIPAQSPSLNSFSGSVTYSGIFEQREVSRPNPSFAPSEISRLKMPFFKHRSSGPRTRPHIHQHSPVGRM